MIAGENSGLSNFRKENESFKIRQISKESKYQYNSEISKPNMQSSTSRINLKSNTFMQKDGSLPRGKTNPKLYINSKPELKNAKRNKSTQNRGMWLKWYSLGQTNACKYLSHMLHTIE